MRGAIRLRSPNEGAAGHAAPVNGRRASTLADPPHVYLMATVDAKPL
jgi:hypothetical protein